MTARQPRDTQLRCDDCGYTTKVTSAGIARKALDRHSCDLTRERAARTERRLAKASASGPEAPCQHDNRHQHGDRARYTLDGCRCRACRDANVAYNRQLARRHLYGRPPLVDANPARDHVRALQAAGMGWKRIAEAAGLDHSVITKLIYGARGRKPSVTIQPASAEKILAVRLELAPAAVVDSIGSARRVQALLCLGWSVPRIAEAAGVDRQAIDRALRGGSVLASTRNAIRDVYDRLWNATPPQAEKSDRIAATRARRRAAASGWVPPLAWDDDSIDDPTATPDLGDTRTTNRGRNTEDLVEDVEFLLDEQPLATAQQLADRLGYRDRTAIQNALRRAGRQDLLDQLARNARLNQEGTAA
ncbi:hypothetical protein GCM10009740_31610 [Terrabacter terrae]|uniref:Helix-turn-helix DNA binding domain protein n=1 Tax=Terrabacter terrae TaxID=318434 RepID=A0ABN2UGZ3_9MICO